MRIVFIGGNLDGSTVEFDRDAIRVGCSRDNDLRLDCKGVSHHHAEFRRDGDGRWSVYDLNSTNGVTVNNVAVAGDSRINSGDVLRIGVQDMRLEEMFPRKDSGAVTVSLEFPKPEQRQESAPVPDDVTKVIDVEKLFQEDGKKKDNAVTGFDDKGKGGRKKISNLLFYTIIGCLAAMAVSYFLRSNGGKASVTPVVEQPQSAFIFEYERTVRSADNVFRYAFSVLDSKVIICLDDLKYGRHLRRELVNPAGIDALRTKVVSSDIQKTEGNTRDISGENIVRKIRLLVNDRMINCTAAGEYPAPEWERVETALAAFAEDHDMQTIEMTPEELLEKAEGAFLSAKDRFDNREAGAVNMREAITGFKFAVSCFEQFNPKPKRWKEASVMLERVRSERNERFKALNAEYRRASGIKNHEQALRYLKQMWELLEPDEPQYEQVRDRIFQLQNLIKRK